MCYVNQRELARDRKKLADAKKVRTPRQIARQFLNEAVRQEIVTKFVIRNAAGGGTVYWQAGGKSFLASVLDVINVLEAHGFKAPPS